MSPSLSQIDVIVPCYRYAHLLRECVNSVLDQPGVNVRVLIIDDASPDHTEEVGRTLARDDARITYRRHEKNLGHIATYNEGIEWLAGDYALLLSADDVLTPGALHRAARLMDANPNVVLVFGRAMKTATPDLSMIEANEDCESRVMPGEEFLRMSCAEADNLVPTPTAIVRTSAQKQVGGYRADLPHAADLEMWLALAAHGDVGRIDADQAFYRVHTANMSHEYAGVHDLRQRLAAFESMFDRFGDRLASVPDLRESVRRNLAINTLWTASKRFDAGEQRACRELLAFALETWPALRASRIYKRFKSKQLIGPRVWSYLRPVVRRLRQSASV